jgi:hypothetical protein
MDDDLEQQNPGGAGARVEPRHGFAPYSQLFSRLRTPDDAS